MPEKQLKQLDGDKLRAPDPDEVEVSLFGPGYGESVLVHLHDNNWLIVDSCLDPPSLEPAPLIYLRRIHVEPKISVKKIVATHWHDDHMRGLADVLAECEEAEFICSGALRPEDFVRLAHIYKSGAMATTSSGIDEFTKVFEILQKRAASLGRRYIPPTFASADRSLWDSSDPICRVYALSPSDASIIAAGISFSKLIPTALQAKRSLIASGPNHASVVIHIDVRNIGILLGSDLQESGDPNLGWSVILDSRTRPRERAMFFKIPHHGSKNAHHDRVWSEMLEKRPVAALTPYQHGSKSLPSKDDVGRILSMTEHAYSTAFVGRKTKVKRDWTVEKTIRETVRDIHKVNASTGQVRLRVKPDRSWKVDLFGDGLLLAPQEGRP